MAQPPPQEWAAWRADNPGATPADVRARFGVHHATAGAWLRLPVESPAAPADAAAPTAADRLAPDDRTVLVTTVRAIHETISLTVAGILTKARERSAAQRDFSVDKDQALALLNFAKTAKELTDAHPGLLELAGVDGAGALGGEDPVERLRAALRGRVRDGAG